MIVFKSRSCLLALAVASVAAARVSADVLLDQPPDFEARYNSFLRPSGIVMGDDFRPAEDVVVETVVFTMAATWPNEPWTWSFSVHRLDPHHEVYPYSPAFEHFYRMFSPSSVTDLGPWPGDENRHVYEVRFDNIGLRLEAGADVGGIYWFSCAGHLVNYPQDRAYAVTANTNAPQGDEGYTKREPWDWPGWIRISDFNVPPCDFAMRIEGVPAAEWRPTTELTSFEVDYGTRPIGDLDGMRVAADDRVFSLESLPTSGPPRHHRAAITATARSLVENPDVIDVCVTADLQRTFPIGEAEVWLRNWSTGEFESVGVYDIYDEMVGWSFHGLDAANRVDAEGMIEIKFEVRLMTITRFTFRFETNIDRVRIDARRVD
jgi:hypothetical protein